METVGAEKSRVSCYCRYSPTGSAVLFVLISSIVVVEQRYIVVFGPYWRNFSRTKPSHPHANQNNTAEIIVIIIVLLIVIIRPRFPRHVTRLRKLANSRARSLSRTLHHIFVVVPYLSPTGIRRQHGTGGTRLVTVIVQNERTPYGVGSKEFREIYDGPTDTVLNVCTVPGVPRLRRPVFMCKAHWTRLKCRRSRDPLDNDTKRPFGS